MPSLFNSLKQAVKDVRDEVDSYRRPHGGGSSSVYPAYHDQHQWFGQPGQPANQRPQGQYGPPHQGYPQYQGPPPNQQYQGPPGNQAYPYPPQQPYQQWQPQPPYSPPPYEQQSQHGNAPPIPPKPQQGFGQAPPIPPKPFSIPEPIPRPAPTGPVIPKVKGQPRLLGLASDPRLNRDSGGSVRLGDRLFWAYRDTQYCNPDGSVQNLPIICNTGSWSDYGPNGGPALMQPAPGADLLKTMVLRQYGQMPGQESFFSLRHYDCHVAGNRDDGTRICIWPDIPPIVTQKHPDGRVTAYSWIKRSHITSTLGTVVANPATALYRIDYNPSRHRGDTLPDSTLVNPSIWDENCIPYGNYGTVISPDGQTLYLYGMTGSGMHVTTSLARVPVARLEHRDAYEFFVDGQWTRQMPSIGQPGIALVDSNVGGQGNYFWSHPWQSYVWIGGGPFPGASFFITTAPKPEGPWIRPIEFLKAPIGTAALPAYSLQAHPDMILDPNENAIYLTYTKNDKVGHGNDAVYSTPLYYVEWE